MRKEIYLDHLDKMVLAEIEILPNLLQKINIYLSIIIIILLFK